MRLFTLLKNIILAIKSIELPTFTPVQIEKSVDCTTNLEWTGITIQIPANSYVCLTCTAIWSKSKPSAVQMGWTLTDRYLFAESGNSYQSPSCALNFYTDKAIEIYPSVKYSAASKNTISINGFYITWGGSTS